MNFKEMTTDRLFELRAQIDRELEKRFDEISTYRKDRNKADRTNAKAKEFDPYKEQVAQLREVARELGEEVKSEPIFYRDKRKEGIRVKVVYGISDKNSERRRIKS